MLAALSESLVDAGLQIEGVTTNLQRHRRKEGGVDFVIEADCVTTDYMDREHLEKLTKDLESLKQSLELDVMDVRVQRLVQDRGT